MTRASDSRPGVLLSEGSSSSARQTLYALGRRYRTGVLDPSRMCQCRFSRLVRRFHRCPSFSQRPAEYLDFLVRTVRDHRYDVLLPTHEQVYLLSRFRKALGSQVGLALPDFDALRRLQSKADFARLLDEVGLAAPPTRIVRSLDEVDESWEYPCYLKLPHSTAGNGVRLARNTADVRRAAEEFSRQGQLENVAEIVVQQPAKGRQAIVETVFQHGRLVGAHCAEGLSIGIGGGQMHRASASHPGVIEDVRRLGKHLDWHGALFIDYFYDAQTGRAEYIEANPRIGETVNAVLSGVNLVDLLVRISLGEEVPSVEPSAAGVRSHTGFLLLVAAALKGANRRQLLAELWRAHWGLGRYRGSQNEHMRPVEDWLSLLPAGFVTLRVLLRPAFAHALVKQTVDNYSLPEAAARQIEALPEELLAPTGGWRASG